MSESLDDRLEEITWLTRRTDSWLYSCRQVYHNFLEALADKRSFKKVECYEDRHNRKYQLVIRNDTAKANILIEKHPGNHTVHITGDATSKNLEKYVTERLERALRDVEFYQCTINGKKVDFRA